MGLEVATPKATAKMLWYVPAATPVPAKLSKACLFYDLVSRSLLIVPTSDKFNARAQLIGNLGCIINH
jgi:hypothetical protein